MSVYIVALHIVMLYEFQMYWTRSHKSQDYFHAENDSIIANTSEGKV